MNIPALKNAKTGLKSYTLTMTIIGFAIVNIKLLISGVQITETIKSSDFSGIDYGACIAALGGIHLWNKKIKTTSTKDEVDTNA